MLTGDGGSKDDVKIPEGELGDQIQSGFDDGKDLLITVTSCVSLSPAKLTSTARWACVGLEQVQS